MERWMKTVWAVAAVAVVGCLWALVGSSGGAGGSGAASAGVASDTPEYFTHPNPARSTVEYGVRENGETRIYNSVLVK